MKIDTAFVCTVYTPNTLCSSVFTRSSPRSWHRTGFNHRTLLGRSTEAGCIYCRLNTREQIRRSRISHRI